MLYHRETKTLFFEVPRCASQSCAAYLQRLGFERLTPPHTATVPAGIEPDWSIAIVRHPADWLVSWWAGNAEYRREFPSFGINFIRHLEITNQHVIPGDPFEKYRAMECFRYEWLPRSPLGGAWKDAPILTDRRNESPRKYWTEHCDAETKGYIRERYALALERYGYRLE